MVHPGTPPLPPNSSTSEAEMKPVDDAVRMDAWVTADRVLLLRVSQEIRYRVEKAVRWPLADLEEPVEDAIRCELQNPK